METKGKDDNKFNKMTHIQHIYLSWLSQALNIASVDEPLDESQVQALVVLAAQQGTLPLVADQLLAQGTISDVAKQQLKQVGIEAMIRYDRHRVVVQRVVGALEEAGLQPIVMKGLRLAAIYPKPYLRQWGDMDVLVDGNKQDQMVAAMERTFPDADHHIEYEGLMRHLNFELKEGVIVEVHRNTRTYYNAKKFRYYQLLELVARQQSMVTALDGITCRLLEVNFDLLFVFIHAWEHFVDGTMQMRQLCDLALMQMHYANQLDKDYLSAALHRLHLWHVWQAVQWALVEALGMPVECAIGMSGSESVRKKAERLVQMVLEGKRRARIDNSVTRNYVQRKWTSFRSRIETAERLWVYDHRLAVEELCEAVVKGVRRSISGEDRVEKGENWVKKGRNVEN